MTVSSTIATLPVTVFTALILVGCAHSPQADPTAVPVPTPTPINVAALLTSSGEATGALKTFRFQLEHNKDGGTPLTDILTVTEADGTVVSPDGLSVEFAGTLGNFAVRSSLITPGRRQLHDQPDDRSMGAGGTRGQPTRVLRSAARYRFDDD